MIRLVALLIVGSALCGIARAERFESTQWAMGTSLRVITMAKIDRSVVDDAVSEVHALESLLSTWRDDTPLSRFNREPAGPTEVDAALFDYLLRATRDHERTRGAFDPSVGTLRVDPEAPLGMDRLGFDDGRVIRPHASFTVDSGGDGKGLAVDALVDALVASGAESFLVDFGGSSWAARGEREPGQEWQVGLMHFDRIIGSLALRDRAASISSTLQVGTDARGLVVKRNHLIDPRTREAVTAERTVAVLASTAVEAEVVSTALAVDGLEAARAWLGNFEGVEILVVEDGHVIESGPSFTPRTPAGE